jgi:membrane protease YdiL (CAAX protease family)
MTSEKGLPADSKSLQLEKVLTAWGLIVILWSLYRANIHGSVWLDECLVKPLLFILPVYYCLVFQLKTSFCQGLGFTPKKLKVELLFAVSLGLLVLGLGLLLFFSSKGSARIVDSGKLFWPNLLGLFILSGASAVSEEIVGRGFLFNQLLIRGGNFFTSLFLSSILFFVLYLPTILATNTNGNVLFINLIINLLLSFMLGILFYLRRNIYNTIIFHFSILFLFSLLVH